MNFSKGRIVKVFIIFVLCFISCSFAQNKGNKEFFFEPTFDIDSYEELLIYSQGIINSQTKKLTLDQTSLTEIMDVKQKFDDAFIIQAESTTSIQGCIKVFETVEDSLKEMMKTIMLSCTHSSSRENINFKKNSIIGDLSWEFIPSVICAVRGNILVDLRIVDSSSADKGTVVELQELAKKIDRKICEINDLPLPEVTDKEESSLKDAQLKKINNESAIEFNGSKVESGKGGEVKSSSDSAKKKEEISLNNETDWLLYLNLLVFGGLIAIILFKRSK